MGAGAFIEPLVVVSLLFGGAWVNRNPDFHIFDHKPSRRSSSSPRSSSPAASSSSSSSSPSSPSFESGRSSLSSSTALLDGLDEQPTWRHRELRFFGFRREVVSPNTRKFQHNFPSRLLKKFPFLVEVWYWALIYWVYQLGRAFSAVTMVEGTVNVARRHALQLIHLEQRLHIFFELGIQHWFLQHPFLMHWTNRIYSFIHIPGTILYLIWLFWYTTMRNRVDLPVHHRNPVGESNITAAGPKLYAARRRTMAVCNLIAFVVFTLWPCMPPRLLSDPDVPGAVGKEARRYGFVDTVHGAEGESSVWTQNKFCNQYAAMPSLHFGYSLLIGLTIMTIPLAPRHRHARIIPLTMGLRIRVPSPRRLLCILLGVTYPLIILTAIVATANHFILDAVAGATVCSLAWAGNCVLLNLLPLEDYFLWLIRIHKPERRAVLFYSDGDDAQDGRSRGWGKGVVVD